jgi:L-alanine-DL-glutamate epimerase-like enolase superfamily enzyme
VLAEALETYFGWEVYHHASPQVRPDLGLNSLTKIKRVAAIAETHYVAIAPFHNGGPIGALAGIHLNAALIHAYAQQIPVSAADRDAAMRAEITSGLQSIRSRTST